MPLYAIPFPSLDPVAIAVGPIVIRWYALAYVTGIVLGWWYARRLVAAASLWGSVPRPKPVDIDDLIVWAALGIVLGGRIGYVLFYNLPFYLEEPLEAFKIWQGGMSFHGGFVGSMVAIILFARNRKLGVLSVLDVASVVAPIGLFFGRIANFVNGELWGRPSPDLPWGVVFPGGGPLPRHPSQIYEALTEGLCLFVVMLVASRVVGFRRPGLLGGIFILGYPVARIICEVFREPDPQLGFLFGIDLGPILGGLTMGQLLSIPMIVAGLVLIGLAGSGRTRPPESRAPVAA